MGKATKQQMIARESDIREAVAAGRRPSQFAKELARTHKCSEGSIVRQYRDLIKQLAQVQKEQREELRAELMMRNNLLYEKALQLGNIKNAIDAVNLQAKIGGLYQPDKAEDKQAEQPPAFNFKERENSVPLAVVPKDDDDRDAGNS